MLLKPPFALLMHDFREFQSAVFLLQLVLGNDTESRSNNKPKYFSFQRYKYYFLNLLLQRLHSLMQVVSCKTILSYSLRLKM
jgi:hypothetical protein